MLDELVQLQVRERFSKAKEQPQLWDRAVVGLQSGARDALMAAHSFRSVEEEEGQSQIISVQYFCLKWSKLSSPCYFLAYLSTFPFFSLLFIFFFLSRMSHPFKFQFWNLISPVDDFCSLSSLDPFLLLF